MIEPLEEKLVVLLHLIFAANVNPDLYMHGDSQWTPSYSCIAGPCFSLIKY